MMYLAKCCIALSIIFIHISESLKLNTTPLNDKLLLQNNILKTMKLVSSIAISLTAIEKVSAKTIFDTDVYGDKELKIATVNKIKQKLRNGILNDPSIAPDLLRIAINDALGYDSKTQDGGSDGSIKYEINKIDNKSLEKGLELIENITKELKRTTSVSFSDICAFAGAEALETVGCSRLTVQIGRYDAKDANKKLGISWDTSTTSVDELLNCFITSGLSSKELVVLIGALGEISRVVLETKESNKLLEIDEDDKEFEEQPFVPTTFGARDAIYGAKLGKGDFSNKYFKKLLENKLPTSDLIGNCLLNDGACKALVQKYASNEAAFKLDINEVYNKLTSLGEAYTTRNS